MNAADETPTDLCLLPAATASATATATATTYSLMTPGIHLVHKPAGPTSFSVVTSFLAASREKAGKPRKICHGGTLDPFASGLLLILVEPATRLFDYLHDVPKVYEATVRWGIETDNGDPLGKVTFTGDASCITPARLDELLAIFAGWQEQVPHATSAKRVDGERAYVRAHRGETVLMPASRVYLHEACWLGHDLPGESRLRVTVRGGYYIRALARDMGRALGCGAHVSQLHRAAIGPWVDPGVGQAFGVSGRDLLPWLPSRVLTDQEVGDLRQKRAIAMGTLTPPDWPLPAGFPLPAEERAVVRAFHRDRFCFLLRPQGEQLEWITALRGGL